MQLAVTTPLVKSMVLGGVLIGIGAFHAVTQDHGRVRRLALDAPVRPGEVYLSAWRCGDVRLRFESDALRPLTFHTRAQVSDGCEWVGVETLLPLDERTYHYEYSEIVLSCEPGSVPLLKTPRSGRVRVVE
ncbi:MAG: hypothetical protein ACTHU0_36075 [Kofleriaceae bacterium]